MLKIKKIISTSFTFGSTHDYKLFKNSNNFINPNDIILADSGYQGLQKIHKNTIIPIKKNKNKRLSKEDKVHNHDLSKIRIRIEHVFSWLKRFKILKLHYRNKAKRFCLRFNLICGIFNLHLK